MLPNWDSVGIGTAGCFETYTATVLSLILGNFAGLRHPSIPFSSIELRAFSKLSLLSVFLDQTLCSSPCPLQPVSLPCCSVCIL
ncbi:hypothetical protein ARMSODRAFT_160634 [Armillaria solidipes]|uniref:Uncharacterized protein n=1 Tax=Armillaria solidipes TaxID=1076256 RepID=A0A2H3BXQ3_9AGAR|nr:hypothetical protein ARMSODRAFT_160634 [Armillaria solidipes]